MKRLYTSIISIAIVFSIVISPAHAVVTAEVIATGVAIGVLSNIATQNANAINGWIAGLFTNAQDKIRQIEMLNDCWQDVSRSNIIRYACEVSPDDLYHVAFELNQDGFPCRIASFDASSYGASGVIWYIQGTGQIVTLQGDTVSTLSYGGYSFGTNINGKNFGDGLTRVSSPGNSPPRVFVSRFDYSASYLASMNNTLLNMYNGLLGASGKLPSIEGKLTSLNGYVDGLEAQLGSIDADLLGISDKLDDLSSIDTKLGTLNGYVDGLETALSTTNSKLDSLIGLSTDNVYISGYKVDSSGVDYPTRTIPYNVASQMVADLNVHMSGKSMHYLMRDGTVDTRTFNFANLHETGYIAVVSGNTVYWLCDSAHRLYKYGADPYNAILDRISDLISAVNDQSVIVDVSGVQVTVDDSNLTLWNNKAWCVGYLNDSSGTPYNTFSIPYDTATAMLERFNTDYIGQSITRLNQDGTTGSAVIRRVSLTESGYIRIYATNGYFYYLCDNSNTVYKADLNTNYGDKIAEKLTVMDALLVNMDNNLAEVGNRILLTNTALEGISASLYLGVDNIFYRVKQIDGTADDILSAIGDLNTNITSLVPSSPISDELIEEINENWIDNLDNFRDDIVSNSYLFESVYSIDEDNYSRGDIAEYFQYWGQR